jgi:hypothetical protein
MREFVWTDIDFGPHSDVYRVDGYVEYTEEIDYGADADGNRGSIRKFVQNVTELLAYDTKDDPVEMTEEEQQKASDALVRRFLNGG